MKNSCIYLLLFLPLFAWAQPNKPVAAKAAAPKKESLDIDEKIYAKAISYGDFLVAKQALYSLIVKYPERTNYLDSLSRLYFTTGNYAQSILSGKDFMQSNPDNLTTLEMIAVSENALDRHKEALADYEKLYQKTKSLFHAYEIAVMNYTLKRYEEAKVVQDNIINDPKSAKDSIQIMFDQKQPGQYVPYRAAVYNLKGVTQKDQRLFDEAKKSFETALKISPGFVLAKNNLESLNEKPEEKAEEKSPEKK